MTKKQKQLLAVMELAYSISQMIENGKINFADVIDREQFDHLFRMALYRQIEQMDAAFRAQTGENNDEYFTVFISKNYDV
jgi:hypothetical protein